MTTIITSIQYYLFHHRKMVLTLCILLCACMLLSVSKLRLEEDIMDLLPLEDRSVRGYADILRVFHASDRLVFMVRLETDDSSTDLLTATADRLAAALRNCPYIKQVNYRWDAGEINEAIGVLRTFHADLFSAEDARQLAASLTPESLDRMMAGWKRLLQETPAPFLSRQLRADPLGMDRFFMEKLESMQALDNTTVIENGILFASDKRSLLLTATPDISGTDSKTGEKLVYDIQGIVEDITHDISQAVDISWLGGHRFAVDNATAAKRDIMVIAGISLGIISILCLLVFKRAHYFILALLPAFFGLLTAAFSVFLFNHGISAIVLGMGGTLIAIAVDYGIHVLYRVDQLENHQLTTEHIVNTVSVISTPILLCASTTSAAFFVLLFSAFPGYSQLGEFSVIGIAASLMFVFLILPLLITGGNKHKRAVLPLTDYFTRFRSVAKKYNKRLMTVSIIIFILAAPGLYRLHFDGEIEKLNMVSPALQQDWDMIRTAFPGMINTSFIIVRNQNRNALFENGEKIQAWLKMNNNHWQLQTADTSWLLPSETTRIENRNRWKKFWDENRKSRLIRDMTILTKKYGMRLSFFTEFISNLPGPMPRYDIEQMMQQPMIGQMLSSQLVLEGNQKLLLIPFSLKNPETTIDFGKQLNDAFPDASVSNGNTFIQDIIHLIFREFVKLGCLSLVVTLLILFFFTKNLSRTFGFFLPLFQAIVFTFGIMGWANIPLTIMSVLVIIFIFGLVVDYSLFIGHCASKSSADFSQAGGAVTVSALTTLCGLGALVFAKHPALHSIGTISLLGVSSGFFFTLINYGWVWGKNAELE